MSGELETLRRQLKDFEAGFVKEHNRKPGKSDIDTGPAEVKELYRQYGTLKKKQTEEGVWGAHLNKKKPIAAVENQNQDPKDGEPKKKLKSTPSFMAKLGQKLLENSAKVSHSPSLGTDKKSRVFRNKPADDGSDNASGRQSPTLPFKDVFSGEKKNAVFEHGLKLVQKAEQSVQKAEVSKSVPADVLPMKKTLSFSFMNKKLSSFDTEPVEEDQGPGTFAFSTGSKSPEEIVKHTSFVASEDSNSFIFCSQNPSNLRGRKLRTSFNLNKKSISPVSDRTADKPLDFCSITDNANDIILTEPQKDTPNHTDTKLTNQNVASFKLISEGNSTNQNVASFKLTNQDAGNETGSSKAKESTSGISDTGVKSTVSFPSSTPQKQTTGLETPAKEITPKRKRKRLRSLGEEYQDEDLNTPEIAVTWRPDSRTETLMIDLDAESQPFGADISVSPVEKSESPVDSETTNKPTAPKRRKASTAAVSNDNFVRLNMKTKSYRRKGKGMTGGQYKRQQWKQKMAARSESFGTDKCFKCGGTGHWANKCKGNRNATSKNVKAISGEKNSVKETDFPTLREAVNMARGIKLPKKKDSANEKDQADDTKDDDEDDLELPEVIRTTYDPPPAPPTMEPLYELEEDGSLPVAPAAVSTALGKFGYDSFRPGQEKAIMRVLCGQSALMVMSTGAGKSLCYQLPAYMYAQKQRCITLVICPLISLMEDQVACLPPGIRGACLHYNMTAAQRQNVLDDVSHGKLHFLLLSPETLVGGGGGGGGLQGLGDVLPRVAFACIDEAHCVSEWSHHFRPTYLRICKVLKERFGVVCLLGLTATATMVTAASVSQHLGIEDFASATIRGNPVPGNLQLSASRDEDRDQALIALLRGERFAACSSVIVYCTRREQTERVAALIRTNLQDVTEAPTPDDTQLDDRAAAKKKAAVKKSSGRGRRRNAGSGEGAWTAEAYHAGMTAAARGRVQAAFMAGRVRVIVATVAFGMGLDKADVRGVIHYAPPASFESYVQEIGRAGRDGRTAHCHLFLEPGGGDMNELKKHVYANTVDRYVIKRLCQKIFPPCQCKRKNAHSAEKEFEFEDDGIDYSQIEEFKVKIEGHAKPAPVTRIRRVCQGHERAIPIETTVQGLDMKEEGISTLLCYLELHPKQWLENLQPVYAMCTLQCYGGPHQLRDVANKCPPVAVAIAREKKRGVAHSHSNSVTFPVIEVSDAMGWDSAPVKRELKLLQWNLNPSGENSGGPAKSGVLVEFTDLAFHLRSPGDLSDEELDEVVDFLNERVQTQERTEIFQLNNFFDTLTSISHKTVWMCSEECDEKRSEKLKAAILDYFDQQPNLENGQITMLSFARETEARPMIDQQVTCDNEAYVRGDVRAFIQLYGGEHALSGRSIARVLHGIASPCFPVAVWGRVRRFWRAHMAVDFNLLRRMATQELIKLK